MTPPHTSAEVRAYLDGLDPAHREVIEAIRIAVLATLPDGYQEATDGRMLLYQVPLAIYPDTYNRQPLLYAALAPQSRYYSLYLMSIYSSPEAAARFEADYRATGKRYDVGKSCVRFRTFDDLPLNVVREAIAGTPLATFVERAKAARSSRAPASPEPPAARTRGPSGRCTA